MKVFLPFFMLFFYLLIINILYYFRDKKIQKNFKRTIVENIFSIIIFIFLFIGTFAFFDTEIQYYFLYPISKVLKTFGNKYVLYKALEYITLIWFIWGIIFIYIRKGILVHYKIHKPKHFYLTELAFIYFTFYISIYLVVYFWLWKPHLFIL